MNLALHPGNFACRNATSWENGNFLQGLRENFPPQRKANKMPTKLTKREIQCKKK